MKVFFRHAQVDECDSIKLLCDAHRVELGFVMRPSLVAAIATQEVIVSHNDEDMLIGVVHYHHRRDMQTTLYHLVVTNLARGQGVGRGLILALREESHARGKAVIRLKCPEPLPANLFYEHVGFTKVAVEPGKSRPLYVWELAVS